MLSNENFESDYNTYIYENKNNSKLNKIYRKQGVNEIFFPSARTYSRQESSSKEKRKNKYQSRTLKFQSFFGCFNPKNKRITKSNSKNNQLGYFNIDKLIEIGDKYANLGKPSLPLGKVMNNNIIYHHKIKNKKCKIPVDYKNRNYKSNEFKVINHFTRYNKKIINKDTYCPINENKSYIFNDNKRIKKIISKNNMKNERSIVIEKKGDNKGQKYENTIKKSLNFDTDIKNNDIINSSIKFINKYPKFNTKEDLDISNNNNQDKNFLDNEKEKKILIKKINKNPGKYNLMLNANEKQSYIDKRSQQIIIKDENNNLYSNMKIPIKYCKNKEIILNENKKFKKVKIPYNNFYINNSKRTII